MTKASILMLVGLQIICSYVMYFGLNWAGLSSSLQIVFRSYQRSSNYLEHAPVLADTF